MSSMGNMGDIMLVFACGLMVALVVAWNLDLAQVAQVEMEETTELSDVEQVADMLYGDGNAYVEKGTVYQDPNTGKYYLVETDPVSDDGSGSTGSSGSGSGAEG